MEGGLEWRLGGVWRLKRPPSLANAASDFGEERAVSKKDPSQVMSKWVRRGETKTQVGAFRGPMWR